MKSRNLLVNNFKKEQCKKCGKVFENRNPKISLYKHSIWCNNKDEFLKIYNFDKEKLEHEYENCGSVLNFLEKYPFWKSKSQYYQLFKDMNVDVSVKKASNSELVKQKRKKTNLEKYGSEHNFSRNHPSRKKWEKELFENEGIVNVFQREIVKEKSAKTICEKYGEEFWTKHCGTVRGTNIISSLNKQVFDILKENKISFKIEKKIKKPKGYYYAYDILISGKNKIIEVYGDYWHGNPLIYKENDLILKNTTNEIKVKDKWEKDKIKNNFAIENSFEVLIVWEYDLKNNLDLTIKKIIEYAKS